jgi:hypothetical protein
MELDSFDLIRTPPEKVWPSIRARFPVGTEARGVVIARMVFGVFLDLGDGALGLMEVPSLPRNPGVDRVVYPDVGTTLSGFVAGHTDGNRQVRLVAADRLGKHIS